MKYQYTLHEFHKTKFKLNFALGISYYALNMEFACCEKLFHLKFMQVLFSCKFHMKFM